MTTGNTVAITVSAASMAASPIQTDCKELEGNNESRRNHVEGNTEDKRLRNKNGLEDQEGTTISSCKFQSGSHSAHCASAHSHGRAHEMFPSQFVSGGSEEVRSGNAPVMCSDKIHRPPYKQKSGHAEARILDTLGNQNGLKLVFKIDWRNGDGFHSNLPCEDCQRLLCIAMSECKHQIWLCKDDNEPVKLTQSECGVDANGNITRSARRNLELKMV
jgi:hypothetical protein